MGQASKYQTNDFQFHPCHIKNDTNNTIDTLHKIIELTVRAKAVDFTISFLNLS